MFLYVTKFCISNGRHSTSELQFASFQADLKCRVRERTESLLDEQLKLMILSLELLYSLLQLQALRPNTLKHHVVQLHILSLTNND